MLKHFTQVESLASSQSRRQQQLASNIGYQTAPQDQERVAGYQPPPPSSYSQHPHASYNPPMQAGECACVCVSVAGEGMVSESVII